MATIWILDGDTVVDKRRETRTEILYLMMRRRPHGSALWILARWLLLIRSELGEWPKEYRPNKE
jgi:hypothetical protein